MNPTSILPERFLADVLPLSFVVMMIALIVLPATSFSIARKWSAQQPQLSAAALGAATAVTIVGILAAAIIVLAVIGWLPPPTQWRTS